MRLATISDIHIRSLDDQGHRCFKDFIDHDLVKTATHIGLLGDIFDLMAGDHPEYLQRYNAFFSTLESLCEEGKVVYFAEGNHDMHLRKLFRRLTRNWSVEAGHRLQVLMTERLITIAGQQVMIGHGDEYNQTDLTYLRYKAFVKTPWVALVADHVMPLSVLDYLGRKASKKSRAYGLRSFNEEDIKAKFRLGVEQLTRPGVNVVIGGHSHVVDHHIFGNTHYLNNGYPPRSRHFAVVDTAGARLVSF